jgi:manganese/iron transport system permease protein/iron/zinc/copper transport system permease protein
MNWLTEPFDYAFFSRALLAGALVGVMCGAVGVFIVLRRMAYIGHGLSYGLLGGVAVATTIDQSPYAGATLAIAIGAFLIDRLRRLHGLGGDTAIGVVSTALFAVGVAVISANREDAPNLEGLLFGNLLGVSNHDITLVATVGLGVAGILYSIYKPLAFTTYDPDMARAHGVNVAMVDFGYNLLVGAVVVASLRVVGVLLITAVLVFPAATARILFTTLGAAVLTAAATGLAATTTGLYISYHADIASGPSIVLAHAGALVAALAISGLLLARRSAAARHRVPETGL